MSGPPFKVKAVYDYESPHDDDLPFNQGQIITVVALEDDDWYEGEYTDQSGRKHSGLFPRNFVERYEPEVPSRPARRPAAPDVRSPPEQTAIPEPTPGAFPDEADGENDGQDDDDDDDQSSAEPPPVPAESTSTVEPQAAAAPVPLPPRNLSPPPPPPSQVRQAAPTETIKSTPPAAREAIKSPPPPASESAPSKPVKAEPVKAESAKKGPPPVSSKPSSFRDRIAAFNNAGAAPVTPFKPAAPTFVKKPFVAPPPSRNAFIAPPKIEPVQKMYRREEDPDIQEEQAQAEENAAKAGLLPSNHPQPPTADGDQGDKPKPQSLKERIAMLQKQQMEQAARRADVSDKPKPKKPVKRNMDESTEAPPVENEEESAPIEPEQDQRHTRQSLDQPRERQVSRGASVGSTNRHAPPLPAAQVEDEDDKPAKDTAVEEHEQADRDSIQSTRRSMQSQRAPAAPVREADVGDQEDTAEDDKSEEDEMDAETRRRLELRERMAKMSGGMGMAGMFGAPPGMPGMTAAPKTKRSVEPRHEADEAAPAPAPAQAPRMLPVVPVPIPGMQTARSPKIEHAQFDVGSHKMPEDDETVRAAPRPVPSSPTIERGPPPPVPAGSRPLENRPVPPLPPTVDTQVDPTEGEESDDELSLHATSDVSRPAPPPVPSPETRRTPSVGSTKRVSTFGSIDAMSPSSPATPGSEKRQSRVPPIPGSLSSPPQTRAGPPPPPPPPPPTTTGAPQLPPIAPSAPLAEPDQGESEYEGDYDTDIASSVNHKDALKSHVRALSGETTFLPDSPTYTPSHHAAPPVSAPRAVPPPLPSQPPPPPTSSSMDAPRVAPPPIPSRDVPAQFEQYNDDDDDDDDDDSSDDLYRASPPRQSIDRPPPPPPPVDQDRAAPLPPTQPPPQSYPLARSSTQQSRPSLDVGRASMNMRRSQDVSRASYDGYIATDVDLAESTLWWAQPNTPPPAFQNRPDILFEVEENVTNRRGGRTSISKDIYVLFIDYSQTVITARYDGQDPSEATFEQRHEPPPQRLRQDQLENYWQKYGIKIADAAAAKKDTVVGNGSPNALILNLIAPFHDALKPVGTRAYGALVYANLANASVQQYDEIRAGDIITLRNAKLQGKHGAMHKSYAAEFGMGGMTHVAVVVDWDGTKKKVRAWEQGRERGKKVKMESYRLGDLRSGECRVWRVVGREWVGWDS
jgi:hypothetical protein